MLLSLTRPRKATAVKAALAVLALEALAATSGVPVASAASQCDVYFDGQCAGTGALQFVSARGTTCRLSTSAYSTPDPSNPTYRAKTSTKFNGVLNCPTSVETMRASLSATDLTTRVRYPASPVPLSCAGGDPWLTDCAGEIGAFASTGYIEPTVLDVIVSDLQISLKDQSDTWLVYPTPAQGADCTTSQQRITCTVSDKRETARDPVDTGGGG